ncbi:hypothetical protein ACRAWD_22375 [Caulobacter segnis]
MLARASTITESHHFLAVDDASLQLAERRRLKAAIKQPLRHIEGLLGGDAYAQEKTGTVENHIAAAPGLGDTNSLGSKRAPRWATLEPQKRLTAAT